MRKSPDTDEALLLSGEPEDFGRFYDRYVQSLLARATPASVWLFAIAHHKLTDYHRSGSAESRMRRRLGIERLPLATEDIDMIRMLGDDVALQLISELPPDQRDAIREHVFEDRDYGDIARDQMATEATVRKRVSRGLSALRARVGGVR